MIESLATETVRQYLAACRSSGVEPTLSGLTDTESEGNPSDFDNDDWESALSAAFDAAQDDANPDPCPVPTPGLKEKTMKIEIDRYDGMARMRRRNLAYRAYLAAVNEAIDTRPFNENTTSLGRKADETWSAYLAADEAYKETP